MSPPGPPFRRWCCGLLLALLLGPGPTWASSPPQAWAYLGWWQPESWRTAPLGQLDRLLFFQLKVAAHGAIAERNGWPEKWGDLRLATRQNHTPLDLTLTLFEPDIFNTLFSSAQATRRLLDEAADLASQPDVAGLQLDFEVYTPVTAQAVKGYRSFVRALSKRLRQRSPARHLSVFLPVGGDAALYDANTLAEVDQVVLQGYDAHWLESKTAGPVAPLTGQDAVTWEKAVALGTSLGVPASRMLLSFPLYGYEWRVKGPALRGISTGKGTATPFAPLALDRPHDMNVSVQERVRQHGAGHDPASGSSYYQFLGQDGQHVEGWFEDWWSLGRKVEYLANKQLGGIAFFLLGYDDGQLLNYYLQQRGRRSLQGFPHQRPNMNTNRPP